MVSERYNRHGLKGEVIVFTGQLGISRREAAELARQAGADVHADVTGRTSLLVVGDHQSANPTIRIQSNKHRKARSLRASGQNLTIIDEAEFHALVGQMASATADVVDMHRIPQDIAASSRPTVSYAIGLDRQQDDAEYLRAAGISNRSDGRWYCRGFSFLALDQAIEFAEQKSEPIPVPSPLDSDASPAPIDKDWIAQRATMLAGRYQFTAEMVYCGDAPPGHNVPNNAYIDTRLEVSSFFDDATGATLPYYPSYAALQPTARRSYLIWLDEGRSDPDTPIGYVFLYFYGLEHRLILGNVVADVDPIAAELRRMLAIYGDNHSFRSYAERLIEVADLMQHDRLAPLVPNPELRNGYDIPLRVKVHLGKALADGRPLVAADALIWVLALPDSYLRTPGLRCFPELSALWQARFASLYPDGVIVNAPMAQIRHGYRATSANFFHQVAIAALPDIGHVSAPLRGLRSLLTACIDDLDPLSRFLGKQPNARGTVAAAVLAPAEIRGQVGAQTLADCRAAIAGRIDGSGAGLFSVRELLHLFQIDMEAGDKVAVPAQRQLSSALDALDYGYEPDRRYGAIATMRPESRLVVFPAASGGPVEAERTEFTAARTMAEIYALAALSDDLVVPSELAVIERDLLAVPDLGEVERDRVLARCLALLEDPPIRREALKRLAALPEASRRQVTSASIAIVLADGRVTPAEVKFLESLHEALGMSKDEVYVALHRQQSANDDMLVTVIEENIGAGTPLPEQNRSIAIDSSRLARIRDETHAVSQLLATIFVEEVDPSVDATPVHPPVTGRFSGLDADHAELVWAIIQGDMRRSQFEASARAAGLLPDGAIETINEWGFDSFGEPVIEDDDPIAIVGHLRVDLLKIGAKN